MTHPTMPENRGDLPPDETDVVLEHAVPQATKTPLFQASNAARYQRQAIIKEIQERTSRRLICYVSGKHCQIDMDDTMSFADLLHNVPPGIDVDLLLHTGGGSVDAAEKIIRIVRGRIGQAAFRIIVPDFAKSAGTVMVLGADSVVMSDTSELGPIDPQTVLFGRWQSVQNYLDAYYTYAEELQNEPGNLAAKIMLGKIDPATIKLCEAAKERARQSAESLLRSGMFRPDSIRPEGNWSATASELLDTSRWLSHSQMISWEDASGLGLVVEYLDYRSEIWQDYWQLYCHQRLAVGENQKLYESDYASLVIDPTG